MQKSKVRVRWGAALSSAALLGLSVPAVQAAPATPAQPATPGALDPRMIEAVDDLVAANRILARAGILPGFGHVSMRSPTNPSRILISRSLAPALVGATDIVELDLDCNPTIPNGAKLYLERFIHCSIYKAKPDVMAVVHSHTPYAIAFASSPTPMRAVDRGARFLGPKGAPVFDIHDVAKGTNLLISNSRYGDAMVKVMGGADVVLLRGHGSALAALSVAGVVKAAIDLEKNGQILTTLKSIGGPIKYVNEDDSADDELAKQVLSEAREWKAQKAEVMAPPK